MSQFPSDPAFVTQFRRCWSAESAPIKFLSELGEIELDRLAIVSGERVVRRLPAQLTADLTVSERRDLARAFGRPLIRQMQRRRAATARKGPREEDGGLVPSPDFSYWVDFPG
jgi:hypothetical protein